MKLTRNTTPDGKCKYALVRLDKLRAMSMDIHPEASQRLKIEEHLRALESHGVLEYGQLGTEEECFVIKLKDKYAGYALYPYAGAVEKDGDGEFADDIRVMAFRASRHPSQKRPD